MLGIVGCCSEVLCFFSLISALEGVQLLGSKKRVKRRLSMEEEGAFQHAVDVEIFDTAVEVLPSDELVGGWLDDTLAGMSLDVKITVFGEITFYFSQIILMCAESACVAHICFD